MKRSEFIKSLFGIAVAPVAIKATKAIEKLENI